MSISADNVLAHFADLIADNGCVREEQRIQEQQHTSAQACPFAADLIVRESSGFELWLGSLDDALCLEGLRERGINAILNCALDESDRECAIFRTGRRGRRRCHARGPSAVPTAEDIGDALDGLKRTDRDQVRAIAAFDGGWYSGMLDCDVEYHGIAADDEFGYAMDMHYEEAIGFLKQCREEKRKVLVHCIMGVNRSTASLVAFLCGGMEMKFSDAVELVSERRGYVLSNRSFLEQLIAKYATEESSRRTASSSDIVQSNSSILQRAKSYSSCREEALKSLSSQDHVEASTLAAIINWTSRWV